MIIGQLLKIYMDIHCISTRNMGKELGFSAATISRILNNKEISLEHGAILFKYLCTKEK